MILLIIFVNQGRRCLMPEINKKSSFVYHWVTLPAVFAHCFMLLLPKWHNLYFIMFEHKYSFLARFALMPRVLPANVLCV